MNARERAVERALAARLEQGLPPVVTDPDVLAQVAAIAAKAVPHAA